MTCRARWHWQGLRQDDSREWLEEVGRMSQPEASRRGAGLGSGAGVKEEVGFFLTWWVHAPRHVVGRTREGGPSVLCTTVSVPSVLR